VSVGNVPSAGARSHITAIAQAAVRDQRPICLDSGPFSDYIAGLQPTTSLLEMILLNSAPVVVISAVTLAEIVTRPAKSGDLARVNRIHAELTSLPGFAIADFDRAHAIETAVIRGQTDLKLPDAAIIATARLANAIAIVGNDRQWRKKPSASRTTTWTTSWRCRNR
jgi:PIN domain nuclease of toxin-antitoxin system